jgi:hypothetical protein
MSYVSHQCWMPACVFCLQGLKPTKVKDVNTVRPTETKSYL